MSESTMWVYPGGPTAHDIRRLEARIAELEQLIRRLVEVTMSFDECVTPVERGRALADEICRSASEADRMERARHLSAMTAAERAALIKDGI